MAVPMQACTTAVCGPCACDGELACHYQAMDCGGEATRRGGEHWAYENSLGAALALRGTGDTPQSLGKRASGKRAQQAVGIRGLFVLGLFLRKHEITP